MRLAMGIPTFRVEIVSAGAGSSATGLSAYITREKRENSITGDPFDFSRSRDDLVVKGRLLRDDAPERYRESGESLWNEIEAAELTRHGKFRRRAQFAKHAIIPLPIGLDVAEWVELTERFLHTTWVQYGLGVEYAIHTHSKALDPNDPDNADKVKECEGLPRIVIRAGEAYPDVRTPHVLVTREAGGTERWRRFQPHAHAIISTRYITPDGIGAKARDLNPAFTRRGEGKVAAKGWIVKSEQDRWGDQWAAAQREYCLERGIDISIAPKSPVPQRHVGRARSEWSETRKHNRKARILSATELRDPEQLLAAITENEAMFDAKSIRDLLHRHEIGGEEADGLVAATLAHRSVLELYERDGTRLEVYTTTSVREQEQRAVGFGAYLARLSFRDVDASVVKRVRSVFPFAEDQLESFGAATGTHGLVAVRGVAGAGKSWVEHAVRMVFEGGPRRFDSGSQREEDAPPRRVIAISPTNQVAAGLRAPVEVGGVLYEGFRESTTAHSLVWRLERGTEKLDRNSILIWEEQAMQDSVISEKVLRYAAEAGARVIVVADPAQYQSVQRGGLFEHLYEVAGSTARLTEVRRQAAVWQQEATLAFARGDVRAGVEAYADRGCLAWTDTLEEAREAMAARLVAEYRPGSATTQLAIASTNDEVNKLNLAIRARLVEAGYLETGTRFTTARGEVQLASGDRVQFLETRKRDGILNGAFGTVLSAEAGRIRVRTDEGREVEFDPRKFDGWYLGLASTGYKSQGVTKLRVYAVYDSAFAWNPRTTYVGLSRHKLEVTLAVPRELARDQEQLIRQMTRRARHTEGASLRYATLEDLRARGIEPERADVGERPGKVRAKARVAGKATGQSNDGEAETRARKAPRVAVPPVPGTGATSSQIPLAFRESAPARGHAAPKSGSTPDSGQLDLVVPVPPPPSVQVVDPTAQARKWLGVWREQERNKGGKSVELEELCRRVAAWLVREPEVVAGLNEGDLVKTAAERDESVRSAKSRYTELRLMRSVASARCEEWFRWVESIVPDALSPLRAIHYRVCAGLEEAETEFLREKAAPGATVLEIVASLEGRISGLDRWKADLPVPLETIAQRSPVLARVSTWSTESQADLGEPDRKPWKDLDERVRRWLLKADEPMFWDHYHSPVDTIVELAADREPEVERLVDQLGIKLPRERELDAVYVRLGQEIDAIGPAGPEPKVEDARAVLLVELSKEIERTRTRATEEQAGLSEWQRRVKGEEGPSMQKLRDLLGDYADVDSNSSDGRGHIHARLRSLRQVWLAHNSVLKKLQRARDAVADVRVKRTPGAWSELRAAAMGLQAAWMDAKAMRTASRRQAAENERFEASTGWCAATMRNAADHALNTGGGQGQSNSTRATSIEERKSIDRGIE